MHDTTRLLWYVLWVGIAGVGASLVAVLAARLIRRRLHNPGPTEAFTLQELREMRDRAAITAQEYEAVRAAIVARGATGAAAPAAGRGAPRGPVADDGAGKARRGAAGDAEQDEGRQYNA